MRSSLGSLLAFRVNECDDYLIFTTNTDDILVRPHEVPRGLRGLHLEDDGTSGCVLHLKQLEVPSEFPSSEILCSTHHSGGGVLLKGEGEEVRRVQSHQVAHVAEPAGQPVRQIGQSVSSEIREAHSYRPATCYCSASGSATC